MSAYDEGGFGGCFRAVFWEHGDSLQAPVYETSDLASAGLACDVISDTVKSIYTEAALNRPDTG